ncbi:MAG: glycosyltransferase family 39 protein [Gemmatimonadetes bacterium]|nr:glycosyltransferase family 39 protein [Gemmatimonadota bacterium]
MLLLVPWYRLVAVRAAGPAVEQTLRLGEQYFVAHWAGLVLGAVLAVLLSWLLRPTLVSSLCSTVKPWLLRPPVAWVGAGLGLLAAGISLWFSVHELNRRPILLDGVSQLVQGRYFAAGMLAGPPLEDPEFWQFQFMVQTDAGWVSQYPPGFAALLSVGLRGGLAWLVGPLLLGLAVYLTTQVAERLFPDDRMSARIGAALVAVSPFLAFHAGAYMNHVLATALLALALFASLRSVDGSWRWALLSGAAVGGLFATRPYVALVLGFFATVIVWAGAPGRGEFTRRDWMRRMAAAASGAAPFVGGVMAYNARLFGDPTRFGYLAAAGPSHGLGFHVDPWGSPYGLPEVIGYTSADLLGLSLDLLQTPVPALVVVALYLLWAQRLDRGTRLAAVWALLPVAANALYWHHDLFMGPRLLYEAAPGWCLLLTAAALGLIRGLSEWGANARWSRVLTPSGVAAVFVLALGVALGFSGPAKLMSYATTVQRSGMAIEAPSVERPSLVFVHEGWESRLGARLSALGMRLDSIRAALRHNSTCEVELFVRTREEEEPELPAAAGSRSELDFDGTAKRPLRDVQMPSGSVIRTYEGEILESECERQAASDYSGIVALPPLLWQGDLPGLGSNGAMFVRDFGTDRNARLLARFPYREPRVLVRLGTGGLRLIPYEQGMEELWTGN